MILTWNTGRTTSSAHTLFVGLARLRSLQKSIKLRALELGELADASVVDGNAVALFLEFVHILVNLLAHTVKRRRALNSTHASGSLCARGPRFRQVNLQLISTLLNPDPFLSSLRPLKRFTITLWIFVLQKVRMQIEHLLAHDASVISSMDVA